MKFPEHEKLDARADDQRSIVDFVDWLKNHKGIFLARASDLIYEYLDVDPDLLEIERRLMLAELREKNSTDTS